MCQHEPGSPTVEQYPGRFGGTRFPIEVVVRSTGERTEQSLIEHFCQFAPRVTVIRHFPLWRATQLVGEVAANTSQPYVLCADADLILRHDAIEKLVESLANSSMEIERVYGRSLDPFIRRAPRAGLFVARPSSLTVWRSALDASFTPDANTTVGPKFANRKRSKDVLALHMYRQYFCHIARVHYVSGFRVSRGIREAPGWVAKSVGPDGREYRAALAGAMDGLKERLKGREPRPLSAPTERHRRFCLRLSHSGNFRHDSSMSLPEAVQIARELL